MSIADVQWLVAAALIFVPLERLLPLHAGQKPWRPDFAVDILHLFVSGFLIRSGAFATTLLLSVAARSFVPAELFQAVRAQPIWAQFVELLILSDLCFYAAHRLVHTVPLLWRFHAVHHSSERMDWLATYRVHPVDQVINSTIIALPSIALGFSPTAVVVYAALYRWHAVLLHSNVRIELGVVGKVLATPRFHHWHHADEPQAYNKNFGGQLAFWDHLFGTAYAREPLPMRYGTGGDVPEGYMPQLLSPFKRRGRT